MVLDPRAYLELYYDYGNPWVDSLTAGKTVPVLEWEGAAEALRRADGVAVYSPKSAPASAASPKPNAASSG